MGKLSKEQKRLILETYNIKTTDDINTALKDIFGDVLQEALEAELDTELGYEKNGSSPDGSTNRRNGHTKQPEIRKLIYTTNMIESYHRQLRKVTKGKFVFQNDEALLKMLYLVTQDGMLKWTGRIHNWRQILL